MKYIFCIPLKKVNILYIFQIRIQCKKSLTLAPPSPPPPKNYFKFGFIVKKITNSIPLPPKIILVKKKSLTLATPPPPKGAPVSQWIKRWPTDLADRVRSSLEVKSSQPETEFHCTQPFIIIRTSSCYD